jgi:uncharacterized protein
MKEKKKSLLWQIKGGLLVEPVYLFGTMHVRDQRVFRHIEHLKSCVQQCDNFAAEFDLTSMEGQYQQKGFWYKDDFSLKKSLNKNIYEKLSLIFKRETGLKLAQFNNFLPVAVHNILTDSQFQHENSSSLDEELAQFAQIEGKMMWGLESFEAQADIIGQMPIKAQLQSLKSLAVNFGKTRRQLKNTTELYLNGDIISLLKQVKQTAGAMKKMLLYDRNEIMARRIIEIGKSGSLFAAVGAGHLAGERGLLRLLKLAGCRVEALPYGESEKLQSGRFALE